MDASDTGQDRASESEEPPRPTIAASALRAATTAADTSEQEDAGDRTPQGPSAAGPESELVGGVVDAADAGADTDTDTDTDVEPVEPDANLEAWRSIPLATRIEALLFAATDPVPFRRLQNLAGDVDASDVRDAIESLQAHYKATARAFGIQEIGGGYQLRTEAALSELLARLGRKTSSEKLSPAAIETLAIVAYRQPVLRVDVEKIRGVASGEVLRTLVEKGVVRVAGRADLPGSPLLYGTTAAFLEIFGLRDLRDLPSDRELLR